MVIIYHKINKNILASYPSIYELSPHIQISGWDEPADAFAQAVIDPEEAKDFEDPRNPKNIHDYRFENGKLIKK